MATTEPPEIYEPFAGLSLWGPRVATLVYLIIGSFVVASVPEQQPGILVAMAVLSAFQLALECAIRVYLGSRRAVWNEGQTVPATVIHRYVTWRGAKDKFIVEYNARGQTRRSSIYVGQELFHRIGPGEIIQIRIATKGLLANVPPIPTGEYESKSPIFKEKRTLIDANLH